MEPDNLEWQIDARARAQRLLLSLFRLASRPNALKDQDQSIFSLLTGAAFSLWRAAFLVTWRTYERDVDLKHETMLLKKVVEDNSVGFNDDKRSAAWSFAYYLDNARVRIRQASNATAIDDDRLLDDQRLPGLTKMILNRDVGRTNKLTVHERFAEWDRICDAAERLLKRIASQ